MLYNIIRISLKQHYGHRAVCGWIDSIQAKPGTAVYLAKVHRVPRTLQWRSRLTFYTYRDVRSALVSAHRKFGTELSFEFCRREIREFKRARRYANQLLRYEDFSVDLEATVRLVGQSCGIPVDPSKVLAALPVAGVDASHGDSHRTTLMHGGHATQTGSDDWRTQLPVRLQRQINEQLDWWLEQNGYASS